MLSIKTTVSEQGRMVEAEGDIGDTLFMLLTEAKALSLKLECGVQFEFNGRLAYITPLDDVAEQMAGLLRAWGLPPFSCQPQTKEHCS